MTYQALETSVYDGQPVELFKFRRRAQCWRYTSADQPYVHATETYLPLPISRGDFERSDEAASSEIEVRMALGLALADELRAGTPPTPVTIEIFRLHRSDLNAITLFRGVVSHAQKIGDEIVVKCVSPLSSEEKEVPRFLIMRTCPNVLYGDACALDPADWDLADTVASVTNGGITVTTGAATTKPDNYFQAGVIELTGTDYRGFIVKHVGNVLTLLTPVPGLIATSSVNLLAGCDRLVETCRDRFDNVPNFNGFPLHPDRNPFVKLDIED